MEKNILPFIELEDIASFNYPVYAHMKEKDGITIYETLEEHTNRCKYYFKEYFIKRNLIVWYEDLVKHWSLKTKSCLSVDD
ncbi:MAG: hypothetical protein ACLR43_10110 [Faecalibacillus faecis]